MTLFDWTSLSGATDVRTIARHLAGRRLVALAGAGVSWDSGLPVANELRDEILTVLRMPAGARTTLIGTLPPFELIIETLAKCSDPNPIYRIYQAGVPGPFHQLAAQLTQAGHLAGVITTNFDGLFEAAFAAASVPYERVWQEHALAAWRASTGLLPLLKIHGSAHDETSLGITIHRVAGQRGIAAREAALQQIISSSGADAVLVVGYSGSDRFDLTPILARLAASAPPVVLIAHQIGASIGATVEPLAGNLLAGPFKSFVGVRVACDTGALIRHMAGASWSPPVSRNGDWRDLVACWFREATIWHGPSFRPYAIGSLMRAAARPRDARGWFRKAADFPADQWLEIETLLSLARCDRDIGKNLEAARGAASKALRLSRKVGIARSEIAALIELGVIAADKRKFVSALRYYREAEVIARCANETEKLGIILGNAAIARKNIGGTRRLRRALRDYTIALNIARDIGDKRSEGRTLGNIGIAYSILGDPVAAISQFRFAGDIARELGDVYHEAIWLVGEAHDTFASDPIRAIDLTLRARSMFMPLSAARVKECNEHLRRFGQRP